MDFYNTDMARLLCRRRSNFCIFVFVLSLVWISYNVFLNNDNNNVFEQRYENIPERHKDPHIIRSTIVNENKEFDIDNAKNNIHGQYGLQQRQIDPKARQPVENKPEPDQEVNAEMINNTIVDDKGMLNPPEDVAVIENPPQPVSDVQNDPNGPGENGKAVIIDVKNLSPAEKIIYDKGWEMNAFNLYASDMISVHRSLPDVRNSACKSIKYSHDLPDTSVIVIFNNEAWSVLIRTVHSVLDQSPPHLLKEIILVDDFSDLEHLHGQLEDYIDNLPKVKLVRLPERQGLIRARLEGAKVAIGHVLTFLDSHCEATEGWLEPLMSHVGQNDSNVVAPVIGLISDRTLAFRPNAAYLVGGFNWDLVFNWHVAPERDRSPEGDQPIKSPTMAGGLFSISRAYFNRLGTYDPGMLIWGSENLELSFRIWMCGGSLEQIPCSNVGHIFRNKNPHIDGDTMKEFSGAMSRNAIRLAEVWMDEYKIYYYEAINKYPVESDYGDITERKELRQSLHCKGFDWYLKTIFPELFNPTIAIASGEILNMHFHPQTYCLDAADKLGTEAKLQGYQCHHQGGNQHWMMDPEGKIRRGKMCLVYRSKHVSIGSCDLMGQTWIYDQDNTIRHQTTNLCLGLSEDGHKVELNTCTGSDRQMWNWIRKTPK